MRVAPDLFVIRLVDLVGDDDGAFRHEGAQAAGMIEML